MGAAKSGLEEALKPTVQAVAKAMRCVETPGGKFQVRWNEEAAVTPFGQMAFFIEFLNLTGVLDAWIAEKTRHARQERLTITPVHGKGDLAKTLLTKVSAMLQTWQRNAEQLPLKTVWESVCDHFL